MADTPHQKLFDVRDTQDFEDIELAGKCGIFYLT